MTDDLENLYILLLAINISSLVKCQDLSLIFNQGAQFSIASYNISLHILNKHPLLDMSFANILSKSMIGYFILFDNVFSMAEDFFLP